MKVDLLLLPLEKKQKKQTVFQLDVYSSDEKAVTDVDWIVNNAVLQKNKERKKRKTTQLVLFMWASLQHLSSLVKTVL